MQERIVTCLFLITNQKIYNFISWKFQLLEKKWGVNVHNFGFKFHFIYWISLLRKGLISKLLRAFREEGEMAPSLMDGFYHLPSLLMVVEAYIMEEVEHVVVNSQRHCWGTSRGNWQVSDVLSYVVLAKHSSTHMHTLGEGTCAGGVQAVWNVTWVQMGILFPQSLLDELIRLRGFLKLVVTPYLCRFQSMNIQLWQKLVHHHTVSRANQGIWRYVC